MLNPIGGITAVAALIAIVTTTGAVIASTWMLGTEFCNKGLDTLELDLGSVLTNGIMTGVSLFPSVLASAVKLPLLAISVISGTWGFICNAEDLEGRVELGVMNTLFPSTNKLPVLGPLMVKYKIVDGIVGSVEGIIAANLSELVDTSEKPGLEDANLEKSAKHSDREGDNIIASNMFEEGLACNESN